MYQPAPQIPPAPQYQPAHNRAGTGPAAMPAPRSNRAPHFSGAVDDRIEDFLREYEEFADSCGLSDRQKVEVVTRYTTAELRDFWKSRAGYLAREWRLLRRELLQLYEATSNQRRHTEGKLRSFARKSAESRMRDEDDVIQYYRKFIVRCQPLMDSQRLTAGTRDKIFWEGFHKKDRSEMKTRLVAEHTRQPTDVPFDYLDVFEVARAILGNQGLSSESDDSSDEPRKPRSRRSARTRDRGSDREDREPRGRGSGYRSHERHPSLSPVERNSRPRHSSDRRSSPTVIETKVVRFKEAMQPEERQEIENLIRGMRGLSVHEEAYAMLFAECIIRFPDLGQVMPQPAFVSAPIPATTSFSVQTPVPAPPPSSTRAPWPANPPPSAPWPARPPPSAPWPTNPPPTTNYPSFFRPRIDRCAFCLQPSHRIRECTGAQEYVRSGRVIVVDDKLSLPNGHPIPYDGTRRGLKYSIDAWYGTQGQADSVPTHPAPFSREAPPHAPTRPDTRTSSARIEEVAESHIVQIVGNEEDPESDNEKPFDFFQVFATEKKKRDTRRSKAPELLPPITSGDTTTSPSSSTDPPVLGIVPSAVVTAASPAPAASALPTPTKDPAHARMTPQYRYQSAADDQQLVSELQAWLMEGRLALTTPAHVLAASPTIRKDLVERLRLRRVETSSYEEAVDVALVDTINQNSPFPSLREPAYSLPLREVDVQIGGKVTEAGVIDPGSQIIVMREDLAREVGASINTDRLLQMEGANGATNWTLGCAEYLPMRAGDISFVVHAHVVKHAPFRLLLGRPFQHALLCRIEDLPSGDVEVSVQNPSDSSHRISIPSRPRKVQVASVKILSLSCQPEAPSSLSLSAHQRSSSPQSRSSPASLPPSVPEPLLALPPFFSSFLENSAAALAYKKVAKKVRPVPASLPEDFRILRRIPSNPLLTLPALLPNPPDFTPGTRLTQERLDALELNKGDFLLPEELKLLHHVLKLNEFGLAWTEAEKGRFRDDYFSPVKIPVVEHIPWAYRNFPIPPGILDDVIQIFKDKFAAGVYEHSDASYRSRWFTVKKKNGALRIVHDLQPLNAVTIRNSGVPPLTDQLIESMAGRSCYTMLDLFVGYDHRTLDISSRDLTTVQSPLGAVRLTSLPMGWTNAVAIFHEDVTFILEPEIPHVAWPFVDDCSIKGPATRSETSNGGYETIPENPGIRKFIWQHLVDVHRILHRLSCAGATVSANKLFIAVPEVIILGHKCNYEGRVPDDSKIARIRDWPTCKSLTDVRAFLGTTGFMRIWIKNYSALARPLVNLTRKGQVFAWTEEHDHAMQALKRAIIHSPALISIDYSSHRPVYLGIDSSSRGVGWILSQECLDNKRRPARFGSISWNEREARYSQPKLELYGLFRALRALRVHLIGIRHLVVEMDAQFIKGMLHNPDIQPNATINRWIAAILLFDFKLVHIPADKHHGPDGLSRREPAEGEGEDEDPDDWIDRALSLGLWVLSWLDTSHFTQVLSLTQAPSDDDSSTGSLADFPVSDKTLKAEKDLARVEQYLHCLQLPADLDGKASDRLLRMSARFFLLNGRLWRRQSNGRHQLLILPYQRPRIVHDAHDNLGHRGFYSTRRTLLDRFWWPSIDQDVKWYVSTCHQCQLRQTTKIRIPPIVATPAPLFRKAYIDTMFMPLASGFRYIVQARCSLSAWPEWRALRSETGRTLGSFIFEEILCRWGAVEEIVTDNGTAYVAALDWLATKFGIRHIRISAYNSRANGVVERQHRTIRESLVKACADDTAKWPVLAPLVFWADRATTRKSTGYSPFYMAHGIEPILPFDLTLATFLVPDLCRPLTTAELLAIRVRQLQKRQADLDGIHDRLLKSRHASAQQFEKQYQNTIKDHDFGPGRLVLVRNAGADSDLASKTRPRYYGPMVVIRRSRNGAYRLAELDGAVSKLRYAAFRLIPYLSRSPSSIPVTRILDRGDLTAVIEEEASRSDDDPEDCDDA